MKQLFLLRHAKSSWSETDVKDIDRPLNKRGKVNAPRMAKLFHKNYGRPDAIVCSPAKRTLKTAEFFAEEFGMSNKDILIDQRIYEAPVSRIIQVLSELPDEHDRVLLVGHNPGLSQTVHYLTGTLTDMPTSGLAVIELHVDSWFAVSAETGSLTAYHCPKKDLTDL
jgi:phosphohistidine phosphatase